MEDQTQTPATENTQDSGNIQPTQGTDTAQASAPAAAPFRSARARPARTSTTVNTRP